MATTWHIEETVKMEEGQKKGTVNGHERGSKFSPASVSFHVEGCSNRKDRADEEYKKPIV